MDDVKKISAVKQLSAASGEYVHHDGAYPATKFSLLTHVTSSVVVVLQVPRGTAVNMARPSTMPCVGLGAS